jgi:hypothetical protein
MISLLNLKSCENKIVLFAQCGDTSLGWAGLGWWAELGWARLGWAGQMLNTALVFDYKPNARMARWLWTLIQAC